MTRPHHLARIASLAAALLLLGYASRTSQAQQVKKAPAAMPKADEKEKEEEKFIDGVTLPVDRNSRAKIQAAQDYMKKKEWRTVAECLQELLDAKEDSFVETKNKAAQGRDVTMRVSVRTEANRLLGELPKEGLESYQVLYGQLAADRLKDALANSDPQILAEVSQRFLHTDAGIKATELLGTYHLDRGQFLMAALCFDRLLSRPDADQLPLRLYFKAAIANRRSGDLASADRLWSQFAEKLTRSGGSLVFHRVKLTLEQLRKEFERDAGADMLVGLFDWPVFRGSPSRNAKGIGSAAYLEPRWTASMMPSENSGERRDRESAIWIRQQLGVAYASGAGKPILPALFPVAAGGRLIVRTYNGVYAYPLKNGPAESNIRVGKELWGAPTTNSLFEIVGDSGKREVLRSWYETYYIQSNLGPFDIFFGNSVLGTLSHDNQRVYFIDDLAVPPHPSMMGQSNMMGESPKFGAFADDVYFNRLVAVDMESGKRCWPALGGRTSVQPKPKAGEKAAPDKAEVKDLSAATELLDSFFLGPPLPLGGKLYLMVEKNTEFRLLCLDPNKLDANKSPEIVWMQTLGTANDRLPHDGSRRIQAVHLAYADGVLVCPTNAGAVLGVDLLSHSLVWAHSYRQPNQKEQQNNEMMMMQRGMFIGNRPTSGVATERWRPSAPCIERGKVVFTAPDGPKLHCIRLRDGQLQWAVARDEANDLYLAGVHDGKVLIVGKTYVRALNLDDGKEIWKNSKTGMPSGQGVAAEGMYYLPLKNGVDLAKPEDQDPQILAINIANGEEVSRTRSRKKHLPGNLLFVDGELISQTAEQIEAYPQLKVKLAEISRRLEQNPDDPIGRAERGELLLDKHDLDGAIADLRTALANSPPESMKAKARATLHEAFTGLLSENFASGEKYLPEFKELCNVEVPAGVDAVSRQKAVDEQVRREGYYLSLLGQGRERQNRLLDAFHAYEQFGSLTGNKELVPDPLEPHTRARPDVWSRGRIQGLLSKATEEQKTALEAEISQRWEKIRTTGNFDDWRKFVSLFGAQSTVGKAARRELSERLIATKDPDDLTEAERLLATLCYSSQQRRDDPETAAKALEALTRICLRRGQFENAVGYFKELGTEFADVPVTEGKTGGELYRELFTDKRFLPYLDDAKVPWGGPFRGKDQTGQFPQTQSSLTVEPAGEKLPFFQRHRLVMDLNGQGGSSWSLRLIDRLTGEEKWKAFNLPAAQYLLNGQPTGPYAFVRGHVLVLHLNQFVIAFDLSARDQVKELWRYNLLGKTATLTAQVPNFIVEPAGGVTAIYPEGRRERLGQVVVVESSYVCLYTRDGLVALDLTRPGPSVLWTKSDVSNKVQAFGDDRNVYVVEPQEGAPNSRVRALRAHDGVVVPVPDFSKFYSKKIRTIGRGLLIFEDAPNGKSLRLYDVAEGKDVWKKDFSPNATVVRGTDEDVMAISEKDRSITLLDPRTGKLLFKTLILPEHFDKLLEIQLLRDREYYFLALTRPAEQGMSWTPNVSFGMRSTKINGPIYALSRSTGKLLWICDFLPHQAMILEQFEDLPMLVFASQYSKNAQNGIERTGVKVTAVEKRTGKLVFDKEFTNNTQFHALTANAGIGRIDLFRQDLKVSFIVDDATTAKAEETHPAIQVQTNAAMPVLVAPARRIRFAQPAVPPPVVPAPAPPQKDG